MHKNEHIPVKQVGKLSFYKYPYSDILIASEPAESMTDLWKLWQLKIKDHESAADVLQILIDRGRKTGIQIFLYVESPDRLPEEHRLTIAVLSVEKDNHIYFTPKSGMKYSTENLMQLFGINW